MITVSDIAKMIDHSMLRPELTAAEVAAGCETAKQYNVASVCVRPVDVKMCADILKDSDVMVITVIGFPHGSTTTETKVFETEQAIKDGASEIDMVLNFGRLISGDLEYVKKDVKAVVDTAHARKAAVKVIFENCYLTDELKIAACKICDEAGADFVKTSTGFGTNGATIADLKLMRENCGDAVKVKAAGGIRNLDNALAARAAGAERLGATASKEILEEAIRREKEGRLTECSEAGLGEGY